MRSERTFEIIHQLHFIVNLLLLIFFVFSFGWFFYQSANNIGPFFVSSSSPTAKGIPQSIIYPFAIIAFFLLIDTNFSIYFQDVAEEELKVYKAALELLQKEKEAFKS